MDGYVYQVNNIVATVATTDYRQKSKEEEKRKKYTHSKKTPDISNTPHDDINIHTVGYGPHAAKYDYLVKKHDYN